MTTAAGGLKVIIARAECQLERQRRVKPQAAARLKAGARVETPRFGVDPDVCTGDKSCMRFNGCPSLTLKDNPDPAARRPGGPRRPELRGLRPLRRGRPRRRPLPVVLRDARGPESDGVGARARGVSLARDRPPARRVMGAARPARLDPDRRPRRAGGRRAHRVDRERGGSRRLRRAVHLHPRRGPAHGGDHVLPRGVSRAPGAGGRRARPSPSTRWRATWT